MESKVFCLINALHLIFQLPSLMMHRDAAPLSRSLFYRKYFIGARMKYTIVFHTQKKAGDARLDSPLPSTIFVGRMAIRPLIDMVLASILTLVTCIVL